MSQPRSQPLITIGITAYNAQDTIARAVQSALDQTYQQLEILITDDASTDQTPSILNALQAKHDHITLITQGHNQGVAAARNQIIENAKGDYIAFFDDDDISAPDRIEKQYEAILNYKQTHEDAAIICHAARTQNYGPKSRIEPAIHGYSGPGVAARILFGRPLPGHAIGSFATCCQMAETSLYKNLGGFDEHFRRSEDTDLAVRHALKDGHFISAGTQPLVTQTMTKDSDKTLKKEYTYSQKLLKKHRAFLQACGHESHARAWLKMKYRYYFHGKRALIKGLSTLLITSPVRSLQRLLWALPNIGFNLTQKNHHNAP